ncbi:MAG: hypothetical protein M3313_01700 [Actinomycetota bacterium]|nr:hypothetical protein [Actinomycetota bacterium]
MADASKTDTIQRATNVAALAFGAAGLLAPDALARVYGIRNGDPELRFLTRLWGTRTAVLGVILSATTTADKSRILGPAIAMNTVDVLVALTSTGIPARTRYLAAATSATFAGLGVLVLSNDKK